MSVARQAAMKSRWTNTQRRAGIDKVMESGTALVNGWHEKLRSIGKLLTISPRQDVEVRPPQNERGLPTEQTHP